MVMLAQRHNSENVLKTTEFYPLSGICELCHNKAVIVKELLIHVNTRKLQNEPVVTLLCRFPVQALRRRSTARGSRPLPVSAETVIGALSQLLLRSLPSAAPERSADREFLSSFFCVLTPPCFVPVRDAPSASFPLTSMLPPL